ncbi:hypothetical protein HY469_04595 [Candidatus Roizmanbacteria bacterium]|nr:hypothetical protein [Candidatus Roizmanbacteria bacterium]
MKNLLIYTSSTKKFTKEDEILVKIQIDNSLNLAWKKDDILLFTDFPFEYNGVRAHVLPESLYYDFDINANKSKVLVHLTRHKMIEENELYWCHDIDAYELHQIDEKELALEDVDIGLTHYCYKPEWQFSSFFFKRGARDIFELLDRTIMERRYTSRNNEKTLTRLIKDNAIKPDRYKRLNVTYNITKRCLATMYPQAIKPIKVLHFRPSDYDRLMPDTALNMFMYGKNRLKIPLMTPRLITIFHTHGIK